ncbi:MAG: hypothetical protein ABFD69_14700 [Candidatus Sumerlaeia bacterium]
MRNLSYGMRVANWVKDFEEAPVLDDIPQRVHALETSFWFWSAFCIISMLIGVAILIGASNSKLEMMGLFIALEGFVGLAMHANCANTHLACYRVIWDQQNRLKREMNKISSSDL